MLIKPKIIKSGRVNIPENFLCAFTDDTLHLLVHIKYANPDELYSLKEMTKQQCDAYWKTHKFNKAYHLSQYKYHLRNTFCDAYWMTNFSKEKPYMIEIQGQASGRFVKPFPTLEKAELFFENILSEPNFDYGWLNDNMYYIV